MEKYGRLKVSKNPAPRSFIQKFLFLTVLWTCLKVQEEEEVEEEELEEGEGGGGGSKMYLHL